MSDMQASLLLADILKGVLAVIGLIVALAPVFCWRHLKAIREQQVEVARRVDSHLIAIRRVMEGIDATLRHLSLVVDELDKQKAKSS